MDVREHAEGCLGRGFQLGVDIWSAIDASATKPYGFMRFTPGPGVGGHCLPIDPSYLARRVERQLGHRFRFVEFANEVNRGMPEYVVSRITSLLNKERRAVNGSRILLLGLAYKPGTSDWRESPAMTIAEQLLALGADVRAHDAHVRPTCLTTTSPSTPGSSSTPGGVCAAPAFASRRCSPPLRATAL